MINTQCVTCNTGKFITVCTNCYESPYDTIRELESKLEAVEKLTDESLIAFKWIKENQNYGIDNACDDMISKLDKHRDCKRCTNAHRCPINRNGVDVLKCEWVAPEPPKQGE